MVDIPKIDMQQMALFFSSGRPQFIIPSKEFMHTICLDQWLAENRQSQNGNHCITFDSKWNNFLSSSTAPRHFADRSPYFAI